MRPLLALTGCGPRLEVAIGRPGEPVTALLTLAAARPRNELIVAAVELALAAAGIEAAELGAVAATRGPGSFTGLRVTLATAQALSQALRIPGHGFPSLEVQAARVHEGVCLAVQPTRRGVVYTQVFDRHGELPVATGAITIHEVTRLVDSHLPVVAPPGLPLPPGVPLALSWRSTAEALLDLLSRVETTTPATLLPLYCEPPAASPPARPGGPWPRSQTVS